jgi:hypothetical protein
MQSNWKGRVMPLTFIGSTEEIRHLLFGAPQHDAHCRGWRWHIYVQDDAKRWESVKAELRKMVRERDAA